MARGAEAGIGAWARVWIRAWIRGIGGAAAIALSLAASGCIDDPDCGICDPHNLILESISGVNYAVKKVHLLPPECEGERCPDDFDSGRYFIETIGRCEDTPEAMDSPRGPEEYCRLAPIVTAFGIEFVFNNLLDPASVELVRRRPDNPQLFEVYDWKTQVLEVEGPVTRFNGDWFLGRSGTPDVVTRAVNLSCIDNLRDQGRTFSHLDYEDPATNPCNELDPATGLPMKLRSGGVLTAARGLWDERGVGRGAAANCDTPEDGPDTCCNYCDFALSTKVAKYGVLAATDAGGAALPGDRLLSRDNLRSPARGDAIACDPEGDALVQCRDFTVGIDRDDETRSYDAWWSCPPDSPGCTRDTLPLPGYDKLRETHPDARPAWLEPGTAACTSSFQCRDAVDGHGLEGADCVGENDAGQACLLDAGDPACTEGRCRAPWFVACLAEADTTGPQGYCVDTRFDDRGAGACLRSEAPFRVCTAEGTGCKTAPEGFALSYCDWDEDGRLEAFECCQEGLGTSGDVEACDPLFQPAVAPVARYQRNKTLPEATRDCVCSDLADAPPECREAVAQACVDEDGRVRPGREGQYALKFVSREGGVIYDPAIKGLEWRPADLGAVPRAGIEACAEARTLIAARGIADGWRAHDDFDEQAESYEDFDRAMCSGQEYVVRFAEPSADTPTEHVRDKLGNTLEDKSVYTFRTPQFHVVPGSGFPTDNLRIGACQDLAIQFSNKYDLSPENLQKVELWRIDEAGAFLPPTGGCAMGPVAGGPSCAASEDEQEARGDCTPPCLQLDVAGQATGTLGMRIDPTEFGAVLRTGERYRVWVPGLPAIEEMSDPEAYRAAFWDACGMPLVLGLPGGGVEYTFDFLVDEPKCKEDPDADNVQLSCDNADEVFNPDQADTDHDGIGDVVDLCPTVPGAASNSADSDKDGIGNECDVCRQKTDQYNRNADAAFPDDMLVRGNPLQRDVDGDGIGDVCDNCVVVANCQDYGPDARWRPGDPIAYADSALCQRDDDGDMIGDACQGLELPGAAGPVGFAAADDFDQDGLPNGVDACPRLPVDDPIACMDDGECPTDRVCETPEAGTVGVCDHVDTDEDGVGDLCDTCPFATNPNQRMDGFAQEDDADGDFVGRDCETTPSCSERADPRPFAFFEVAVGGRCCTTALVETPAGLVNAVTGRALLDPDGVPLFAECDELDEISGTCRALPGTVASTPGVLEPPPGCDEALAAAGYDDPQANPALGAADFGGDLGALWDAMCFLPQIDQDYDGLGDLCDLCTFAFDPENRPYIDAGGKLWPRDGFYCNGAYSIDALCPDDEEDPTGGTGTGEGTGDGDEATAGTGAESTGTGG
jgi:hypothetical protein